MEQTKDMPDNTCRICGAALYMTDHDRHEITWHCSSPKARFWDYDRGTIDQLKSKCHWDASRVIVFTGL